MSRKKHLKSDPHARREAEKYENPIPSREYILTLLEKRGQPITAEELAEELLLFDADSREAVRRRLIAMSRDGQIISNRAGLFGLVEKMDLIKGRVSGHKDGYGFLIPEDGSDDLFLSPHQMQKVFDGDTVLCRVSGVDNRGRREGRVVEVLTHKSETIIGRFWKEAGAGIVEPHNPRISQEILIPARKRLGAKDGDFVSVKITRFPNEGRKATGEVVEILGDVATPGLEIDVAVRNHGIPHEFSRAVISETRKIKDFVDPAEAGRRIDLREMPFVTIDGEDAKDFDDAVYCEQDQKGFTLYVAIADVSHYVQLDTALDAEAIERGNSVYFPGHVIPMLPEQLSNGLCSLRPHEDRLVMVCRMNINNHGVMTDYTFFEGVIYSHARLTYTEVGALLQDADTEREKNLKIRIREKRKDLIGPLETLYSLYHVLRKARDKRGALDIDSVETRIVFSEQRKIEEIIPVERNDAHKLIEECMLCANVAAADFLHVNKLPALYRVHQGPSEEKLNKLYDFLWSLGIGLGRVSEPTPKDYQTILLKLADRPDKHVLGTMVIRSLMQAKYQPENLGHFGLGYDAYAHFTSPIRRYPDLMVHRGIRYLVRKRGQLKHVTKAPGAKALSKQQIYPYTENRLEELGSLLSATERRADQATYDVMNWLKCEYMSKHLGDEYRATVTGVTAFGLFVELIDVYVEGLVHVSTLENDYYHFDAVTHTLTGERSHQTFSLGDTLRVQVSKVDLESMRIDLQLTGVEQARVKGGQLPKRSRAKSSKKSNGKKRASKSRQKDTAKNKGPRRRT